METQPGLSITFPYSDATVARAQCDECGKWERSDNGRIRHSKSCDSKVQYMAPIALVQDTPAQDTRTFASNVLRTGLTKGRDQDVLHAVRTGYLSIDAAMNTDD